MRILLLSSAYNSLTQQAHVELAARGHLVGVATGMRRTACGRRSGSGVRAPGSGAPGSGLGSGVMGSGVRAPGSGLAVRHKALMIGRGSGSFRAARRSRVCEHEMVRAGCSASGRGRMLQK